MHKSMSERADWTEPGATLISEGIYRVALPLPNDGLRAVNVYVLETEDGLVLIDSGWAIPESESALSSALSPLGYGLRDIRTFLVTHMHSDHYTQALALRTQFGAKVYLGIGERASLATVQERQAIGGLPSEYSALIRAGAESLARDMVSENLFTSAALLDWSNPDQWLEPNERLSIGQHELDVISTPGHTQGHMVYHDAQLGLLFAGDHILPSITPSIGFEPVRSDNSLRSYLASLAAMLALEDCVLLPAHGAPTTSTHARVHELLKHHENRLNEMDAALGRATLTPIDVAARVTWTSRHRTFEELNLLNQILAVLETDSHLRLLAAEGRLSYSDSDGIDSFFRKVEISRND